MNRTPFLALMLALAAPELAAQMAARPTDSLRVAEAAAAASKVDSLLVTVHKPRERAIDDVVAAFAAARLQVTNTTGSMVEADLGQKAGAFASYKRTVRALLIGRDSVTQVEITGDELRLHSDKYAGLSAVRYRIDNHARAEGGKVWAQMVAVARQLDPGLDVTALIPQETR